MSRWRNKLGEGETRGWALPSAALCAATSLNGGGEARCAHTSSAPSGHLPRKGKVLGVRGGIGLDSEGVRGYNGAKMTPAQAG